MGDTTTNRGWIIPNEYDDPWYTAFLSLFEEVDTDVQALYDLPHYPPDSVIIVEHGASEGINGINFLNAYIAAKSLSPTASKRVVIIVPPGSYSLSSQLAIDTNYIDFKGFGIARREGTLAADKIIQPQSRIYGTISEALVKITATNVRVYNLTIEQQRTNTVNTMIDSVSGAQNVVLSDIAFINSGESKGISLSVGSSTTIASALHQCHADSALMDHSGGMTFSGYASDCSGDDYSFAGDNGVFSGRAERCLAGDDSFGGPSGTFTGTAIDCEASGDSIGTCSSAAVLKGFVNTGRTAALELDGFAENCKFKGSIAPVINIAAGTKLFRSYIIASAEFSVATVDTDPVFIAGCFLNYDMAASVINGILLGYNVVNTAIDIE